MKIEIHVASSETENSFIFQEIQISLAAGFFD